MASTPDWKIYDAQGTYQAACKELEAAAALMGFYGDGATIRSGHRRVVWTEGQESQSAAESFDFVAALAVGRIARIRHELSSPPQERPE